MLMVLNVQSTPKYITGYSVKSLAHQGWGTSKLLGVIDMFSIFIVVNFSWMETCQNLSDGTP